MLNNGFGRYGWYYYDKQPEYRFNWVATCYRCGFMDAWRHDLKKKNEG